MLTISDAFDLLFGGEAPPREHVSYEDHAWFRRPRSHMLTPIEIKKQNINAARSESILSRKVLECLETWGEGLKGSADERISDRDRTLKAELTTPLDPRVHLPPRMPYDVFAIAGYLIEASGSYHHIQPTKAAFETPHCATPGVDHRRDSPRHLNISNADRKQVARVAKAWRNLPRDLITNADGEPLANYLVSDEIWPDFEPLFESWAIVFNAYSKASVFLRLSSREEDAEPAPGWWRHVWRLFAIADEASRGTAFNFDSASLNRASRGEDAGVTWFEAQFFVEAAIRTARLNRGHTGAHRAPQPFDITSLSVARREVLTVLPKVRTPSIGCTLRSLSHHLAITPGYGVARGRWTPNFVPARTPASLTPDGQMNLLIIPFPYHIDAEAFCGSLAEEPPPLDEEGRGPDGRKRLRPEPRFGYFDVHQRWIKAVGGTPEQDAAAYDRLTEFVVELIAAARRQSPVIHAIAFPELSLDHQAFSRIRDHVQEHERDIELLIAGVSEKVSRQRLSTPSAERGDAAQTVKHGNFVAVVAFDRKGLRELGDGGDFTSEDVDDLEGAQPKPLPEVRESMREKHHRWKLDRSQLQAYGLMGVLSPELQWWENIALQSRRVDFTVIRQRSVVSALICEDLARVDPCQQIIRSVAPNLVVALLMDAPQRSARWPSRYATVLAEDPGCAVLSITSRALMARQDRLGLFPSTGADRIVALWRDDLSEGPVELNCPYDAQAVLLSVVEESSEDISLDGRLDDSAMAFRYAGHVPVRLTASDAKSKFSYILHGAEGAA